MEINIVRKRGDTVPDVFLVSKSYVATNLTGCTFKLTVDSRKSPNDSSTQIYQLVGVIDNPASGLVSFAPTLVQSDRVGSYYYDIQMTDSYDAVQTLVDGSYTYLQDITK